ncbi:unnamed protein product [Urochloa humidicola]
MSRSTRRRLRKAELMEYRAPPITGGRRIPSVFTDRCFNCLSFNHCIATCRLPRRCLRCHGFRHIARDCWRPRAPPLDGAKRTGPAAHASAVSQASSRTPSPSTVRGHAYALGGSRTATESERFIQVGANDHGANDTDGDHGAPAGCSNGAHAQKHGTSQLQAKPIQDWATVCATPLHCTTTPQRQDPMLIELACPPPSKMTRACPPEEPLPLECASGTVDRWPVEDPLLLDALPHPNDVDDDGSPPGFSRAAARKPACSPVALMAKDATAMAGTPAMAATPIHRQKKSCERGQGTFTGHAKLGEPSYDSDPDSPPGFSRAAAHKEAINTGLCTSGLEPSSRSVTHEDAKLTAFTSQVQAKIRSPLAPRPAKTKRVAPSTPKTTIDGLPKRSSRLANHPLANVPLAKRAEVVLMRRFRMIPETGPPNTKGKKAYDKLYKEGLAEKIFEAMSDLMPALRNASSFLELQA